MQVNPGDTRTETDSFGEGRQYLSTSRPPAICSSIASFLNRTKAFGNYYLARDASCKILRL